MEDQRPGGSSGSRRWREALTLGAILAAGLLLRVAYLEEYRAQPEYASPAVDAGYHHYWARALATGDWTPPDGEPHPHIERTPFFRPPGYPYFLAAVYGVFGPDITAARLVQFALGLLNCALAFLLGRRLFGSGVGLVFAGLMSGYWSFIYFEAELLEPVVLILIGFLLILALERWARAPSIAWMAGAGALIGLCAVVRPNVLLFAAAAVPWSWWIAHRRGVGPGRFAAMVAAGVATGVLVILPATLRNLAVSGEVVPISANGGINLFIGNNEQADGRVAGEIPGLGLFADCYDYPGIVRSLELQTARPLGYAAASRILRDRALRYIREEPGRTLALLLRKTALFWGPHEVSHNREDEVVREESRILRQLPGGFTFAASASVLGLLLLARRRSSRRVGETDEEDELQAPDGSIVLILLYVGSYFASHLPFFVAGRYRVPIVPFLLLFGAYGLHRLVMAAARGQWRSAVPGLLAGTALYGVFSLNPAGYLPSRANHEVMRGTAFAAQGDFEHAAAAYRQALRFEPGHLIARLNLGGIFLRLGQDKPAGEEYRAVIALRPEMPHPHYNLGLLAERERDPIAAARHFSEALRLMPAHFETHLHLAAAFVTLGRPGEAARLYGRALELEPGRDDIREARRRLGAPVPQVSISPP